ncbi:MAG TPA: FHA domain-containing protein [Alphaproteobacteria bacterium]|nr:FHA domain-containing protein [Alphaproteobacteria bacterium]
MARYSIGRKSDNDIVVQDPTVSRRHAELVEIGRGSYELGDLGSSQGTHVHDGKGWDKIDRQEIDSKTPIRFGSYKTTVAELLDLDSGEPRPTYRRSAGRGLSSLPRWALPAGIGAVVLIVGIVVAVLLISQKPSRDEWIVACTSTGQVTRDRCSCVWDLFEPNLSSKELRELIELFRRNATPDAMTPALRAKWDALSPQIQTRCTNAAPRR